MQEIPYGYCHCGCGQKTTIAKYSVKKHGYIKGEPLKYILGHTLRHRPKNHNSYNLIKVPGHPRSYRGYIREHIIIAEKALGKPLPPKAVVHHANGGKNGGTLVICEDNAYHRLLHRRMDAYKACGHPNWRKCRTCGQYDDPINLTYYGKSSFGHKACKTRNNPKVKDVPYGYCHCGCGEKAPISDRTDKKHGYVKGKPHKFIANHYQRINRLEK